MERYTDINAETIDRWVEEGWKWGIPITHEQYLEATEGKLDVVLTPTKTVPQEWFGDIRGKKLLGLASGGGQQMPVFCAAGADCTVMDLSDRQLESERMVSEREGYAISIVKADMTERFPFDDETFDIIFHPVSNCYIKDVQHVWNECFRVLKRGGILLAGMDNGFNFLFDDEGTEVKYTLPFDPLSNPEQMKDLQDTDSGVQFSHTLEEQLGGQLRAGFVLTDLYEDTNGEGKLHEHNVPCYIASRAVRS
ncbi:MAG: methyltransferase domain-containing protein [Oscillospiraceae bacterium]|nr:methyltransferase domain-containing protein [Oscillospiraceae bacterium]